MSTSTVYPPGALAPEPGPTPPEDAGVHRRLSGHHAGNPRWAPAALAALLVGTAVLYLWGLGASGWANSFYAAAVQAGTKSWKALFFGSLDPANSITVDKPPASLWVMALSGRLFGFSSWSMLAPQALEGVAAVWLLYASVKRWFGVAAGLLAGVILAVTPVAVLMFRFNNPDALLVLLMVAAAYATVRLVESGRLMWMVLAGTTLGFGFLTKMLQAFLVIPALAVVCLVAVPGSWWRRVWTLVVGGLAVLVSAGWWIAAVELWPASSRPYIGGSTNNTILDLVFGYNGLGRITGNEGGGPGGGGGGGGMNGGFGGATGLTRMFGESMGTQISWLLPAALVALVAGLWVSRRAPRTDRTRAALLLWGGWLLVTGLVFSYMQGTMHPYYTVALAPAIGALVAIGAVTLWRARQDHVARVGLALMVALTGIWGYALLDRTPSWYPVLRYVLLVGSLLAAVGLAVGVRRLGRLATVGALVAVLAGAVGTGAYALDTAATPHSGSIPTAGPASPGGMGGGPGGSGSRQGFPGGGTGDGRGLAGGPGGTPPGGSTSDSSTSNGTMPGGGFGGDGATTDSALVSLLRSAGTPWAAATIGSQTAAPLELGSGTAVMAIGGFTGSDPSPTLAQFEAYVKAGKIHYFIGGGGMGGGGMGGRDGASSAISTWVQSHYSSTTVGGQTVYDLTKPVSG